MNHGCNIHFLLTMQTGQWAVTVRVPGEEPGLHFYTCPPGYCQCIYHTEFGNSTCSFAYSNSFPDRRCSCGRKGIYSSIFSG